ncbi:MAG: DUF2125 domain-containing protein [Marinicaulis sp.]|nr:DUF2125 domain-containing protein [Marinicaulis sp.]
MSASGKSVSRRWLYIPFIIAGIILFAYFMLWRFGANEMEKAVHAWVGDQRAAGLTVDHGEIKKSGFPFFLRVIIDDPAIASGNEWRWRGETLALDALPYNLNKLIFSPGGEQEFAVNGSGEWQGRADDFRASIANDETRGWAFALTLGDAAMTRIADGASLNVQVLILDLAPAVEDQTTLTLNLAGENIRVIENDAEFVLDSIKTSIALTQTQYLSLPAAADSWRNAGGALKIGGFESVIGDAVFNAHGEIELDAFNYPSGNVNADIKNPAAIVNALGAAGVITMEDAEAAGAGLTLMALTSGGKISAPVELTDGVAMIGGVKIADLTPVQ